jgi:cytidylate kinase
MDKTIITLDGPAGVGKSTLAKLLAKELGIPFLDTGAMFRGIALLLGEEFLDADDETLSDALSRLDYGLTGSGPDSRLLLNNKTLGQAIRNEAVGALSSKYAARPAVRAFLKLKQQEIGKRFSLVAEGRDMGTVVFPDATAKFFLDADPEVRALRRQKQLAEQGEESDLQTLTAQIKQRDAQDRNRVIAPLKPAEDAVVVDSSKLTQNEVLEKILSVLGRTDSLNACARGMDH